MTQRNTVGVRKDSMMASLAVDLQDGFAGDTVIVRVNGEETYHKEGVTTNLSISLADSCEVTVADGSVSVVVLVPTRHLSNQLDVQVAATPYVGVSIVGGEIIIKTSSKPYRYM